MFTKDINTDTGKVRYLIGDTDGSAPNFQDEELQGFLNMVGESIYLACGLALDSLASQMAQNLTKVKLAYLDQDDSPKYEALKEMAQMYRDLEYNTPAFAEVEQNLCGFSELDIIRNYILRHES